MSIGRAGRGGVTKLARKLGNEEGCQQDPALLGAGGGLFAKNGKTPNAHPRLPP
jgi:hypothetical protein